MWLYYIYYIVCGEEMQGPHQKHNANIASFGMVNLAEGKHHD